MSKFIQLSGTWPTPSIGDRFVGIAEFDSDPGKPWIPFVRADHHGVRRGATWDGSQWVNPPDPPRFITNDQFLDRFTDAELAEIRYRLQFQKRSDGTAISYAQWRGLSVADERLRVAPRIDLNKARVVNYVEALETVGILSAGRAQEILA